MDALPGGMDTQGGWTHSQGCNRDRMAPKSGHNPLESLCTSLNPRRALSLGTGKVQLLLWGHGAAWGSPPKVGHSPNPQGPPSQAKGAGDAILYLQPFFFRMFPRITSALQEEPGVREAGDAQCHHPGDSDPQLGQTPPSRTPGPPPPPLDRELLPQQDTMSQPRFHTSNHPHRIDHG